MTVGDQVGRLVGAPPGSTVMHQNVDGRRGGRPLVLRPVGAAADRLRGGELPLGALPATRPSRDPDSSSARTTGRSWTRSTSGRCSSPSVTSSSRPGDPGRRSDRPAGARGRRARRARRLPVGRHPCRWTSRRWASTSPSAAASSGSAAARERAGCTCGPTSASARPTLVGWQAHARPFALRATAEYADGAARFLTGTPNVPALYAATAGYDIDRGDRRRANTRQLDAADGAARSTCWTRRGSRSAARATRPAAAARCRSTCRSSRRSTASSPSGVICDFRPDVGLRLGPHFFNTDDELGLAAALARSSELRGRPGARAGAPRTGRRRLVLVLEVAVDLDPAREQRPDPAAIRSRPVGVGRLAQAQVAERRRASKSLTRTAFPGRLDAVPRLVPEVEGDRSSGRTSRARA